MDPLVGIREMCLIDEHKYKLSQNQRIQPPGAPGPQNHRIQPLLRAPGPRLALYRSNSTQELPRSAFQPHNQEPKAEEPEISATDGGGGCFPKIRRHTRPEFGSQAAIAGSGVAGRPPPAKDSISLNLTSASPRLRAKFQRFFSIHSSNGGETNSKPQPSKQSAPPGPPRAYFLHYDCQSLLFTLSSASVLLNQRRRTCTTLTGASAAHNATRSNSVGAIELHSTTSASTPPSKRLQAFVDPPPDHGDRVQNHMVASCPHFRNEIGIEPELNVAHNGRGWSEVGIRAPAASSLSVLEGGARGGCIYEPPSGSEGLGLLEAVDGGHEYYKTHFYGQEHDTWLGFDPVHGPIVANLRQEAPGSAVSDWRVIVRTTQLVTLRGVVGAARGGAQAALGAVLPEVELQCLRQTSPTPARIQDQLLKIDSHSISTKYKVGVLYCRAGQATEEEMYGNQYGSPEFEEFLETLGERVRLRGFEGYAGGLDTKGDSTGYESVYREFGGCEIMYHVSTLLPYTASNRQQLLRKRHIGNDVVTVVFQEPGARPFSPAFIRSQFQHVFILVQRASPLGGPHVPGAQTQYTVAVTRSRSTPLFGPRLPPSAIGATLGGRALAEFVAAKAINGERATIQNTDKFLEMATRTRYEYLKDVIVSQCAEPAPGVRARRAEARSTARSKSGTSLAPREGGVFEFFGFSAKKKTQQESPMLGGVQQVPLATREGAEGALAFQLECPARAQAVLAISSSTLALMSLQLRASIFATSTSAVLGWGCSGGALRIYYHVGECLELRLAPGGAAQTQSAAIMERLKEVTEGAPVQSGVVPLGELYALQANGWLVPKSGGASSLEEDWRIPPGSRIVEISGVVAATLTQAPHLAELVLNGGGGGAASVSVKFVPPLPTGAPRVGCDHPQCPQLRPKEQETLYFHPHQEPQPLLQNYYAPNPSAPIKYSSSSEGYGTGSSSNSIEGALQPAGIQSAWGGGNRQSSYQPLPFPLQQQHPKPLEVYSPTRRAIGVANTALSMSFGPASVPRPSTAAGTRNGSPTALNLNEVRLQRLKSGTGRASESPPRAGGPHTPAVRLRPKGAGGASARENANRASTLQEELIKLIAPEEEGACDTSPQRRRNRPVSCGEWNHPLADAMNNNGGGGPPPPGLQSRVADLERRLQLERQSKLSLITQLEELRLENERLKAETGSSDQSFS